MASPSDPLILEAPEDLARLRDRRVPIRQRLETALLVTDLLGDNEWGLTLPELARAVGEPQHLARKALRRTRYVQTYRPRGRAPLRYTKTLPF